MVPSGRMGSNQTLQPPGPCFGWIQLGVVLEQVAVPPRFLFEPSRTQGSVQPPCVGEIQTQTVGDRSIRTERIQRW